MFSLFDCCYRKRGLDSKTFEYQDWTFVSKQVTSHSFSTKNPPTAILGIDLDGTLLDYRKSRKHNETYLIKEEAAKAVLQQAQENRVMVVLLTARNYELDKQIVEEEPGKYGCISIDAILNKLGKKYFHEVIFTNQLPNGVSRKGEALDFLYKKYLPNEDNGKVGLLDDVQAHLDSCKPYGFSTFLVDSEGEYWEKINEYITPTSILKPDTLSQPLITSRRCT